MRAMTQAQEFTVFLASPSADTLDARQAVAEAVKAINLDPGYAPRVQLKLLRWDDPDRTLALSAETNGQVDVNRAGGPPSALRFADRPAAPPHGRQAAA